MAARFWSTWKARPCRRSRYWRPGRLDKRPTLLFDLDGTLTDPAEGIFACIRYALEQFSLPSPRSHELSDWIGPPLRTSFETWLKKQGAPVSPDQALVAYRRRFATIGLFENRLYPGIPSTLAACQAAGYRLLVATAKPTVYATRIIQHFGLAGYFEAVCGSELDGRNSDKTELLAGMIPASGLDPGQTRMIGDRGCDMQAAKLHGMRTLGVLWGYGDEAELTAAGADQCFSSLPELQDFLFSGD